MSYSPDQLAHADALRRHNRSNGATRLRRHAGAMLGSVCIGMVALPSLFLERPTIDAASVYGVASAKLWFADGTVVNPQMIVREGGAAYQVPARALVAHPYYDHAASSAGRYVIGGALLGLGAWLASFGLLRAPTARRRKKALRDRVVAGTRVTTEAGLAKSVSPEAGPQPLAIGTVPIPARLETRHLAMIGTTGSGKTTALRQMLDGIEARGEAALVYDTSGEFIGHYYRPERGDIILNPFDARCAYWSPFAEIAHPADADRLARHFINETGNHDKDVWLETSRALVANMIRALWTDCNCTLPALLHAVKDRTKDDLKVWLADSSSSRTFAEDADRASGSVLFMLSMAADLIKFLRIDGTGGTPFAFRDFIHGLDGRKGPKPWIFVPRKEDYFEASQPLLACWLECAASAVLGLPPSPDRRIWFVLDELADLPRVDNLARLLPEGRKFGAAVVLTFQAVGQMRHRYGMQIAEAMLGCCNTKLFLQIIDSETRNWASQTIGDCEVEIQTMTNALAEGDDRPRTTLGRIRQTRPAIMESELRLPKYQGYLLFPDGAPVARIRLTADHIDRRGPPRHPGFIPGDPAHTLWGQSAGHTAPPTLPPASPTSDDEEGPV